MRLPWPFRRTEPAAPAEFGARRAGPQQRAPLRAWSELPTLDRTIGPPPLVAPPAPFAHDLAANSPPPPMLQQLGHALSLDAPAGLVMGLARPARASRVAATAGGEGRLALFRRFQRRADAALDSWPVHEESAAPDPAEVAPSAAMPPPSLPALTTRRLAPVEGPAAPLPSMPLTRATLAMPLQRAALPAGRHEGAEPSATGSPSGPSTPSVLSLPTTSGPAPIAVPALSTASAGHADTSRSTVPAGTSAARLTLGQSRRLGLGPPLRAGRPAAVPDDRPPTELPLPRAAMDAPATGAPEGVAPPAASSQPPAAMPVPAASPGRADTIISPSPAPRLPLLRVRHGPAGGSPAARPVRTDSGPSTAGPARPKQSPAAAPRPVQRSRAAAIVGRRPLMRSRVQRAAVDEADVTQTASSMPDAAVPAAGAAVRVIRDGSADRHASSLRARAFTHGGDIYLPARLGSIDSGPARALLAHEAVHARQQRHYGLGLPSEDSPAGRRLEQEARAAERSGALPADLELVLARPITTASSPSQDARAQSQRAPSTASDGDAEHEEPPSEVPPAAAVAVQRAPESPAAASTLASVGGAPDAGGGEHDEQQLDELARRLYGRIRFRLRRELLADRERAGLVTDLRS